MSAALLTELKELLTVGLHVNKCQLHLIVKLVAVICDTATRSNVRYVVRNNDTTGCDKCKVLGTRLGGRITFPNSEYESRNAHKIFDI